MLVGVEREREEETDDLGEVKDGGLVLASQPFFHAVLLPFEQFVDILGLVVAWRGRVEERRFDH